MHVWECPLCVFFNFLCVCVCVCVCRSDHPLAQLYCHSTMEHHHFDHCLMILNSPVGALAEAEENVLLMILLPLVQISWKRHLCPQFLHALTSVLFVSTQSPS